MNKNNSVLHKELKAKKPTLTTILVRHEIVALSPQTGNAVEYSPSPVHITQTVPV